MKTDRELMQQLVAAWDGGEASWFAKAYDLMDALRERLAQPVQEPVAYWDEDESSLAFKPVRGGRWVPLYTAPPQREFVGLTLEEMDEIIDGNIKITDSRLRDGVYGAVLDTITTLMEKNT